METNSSIQTSEQPIEVPKYVVRIRRPNYTDLFYRNDEFPLTEHSEEAGRLTASEARLATAKLYTVSFNLCRGHIKTVPESQADDPDPIKISFHVAGRRGHCFDEVKAIRDDIQAKLQERHPSAEIESHCFGACLGDYIDVQNADPHQKVIILTDFQQLLHQAYYEEVPA